MPTKKLIILFISVIVLLGAGCKEPAGGNQSSLDLKNLDYYIENFSSAPMTSVLDLEKEKKLSRTFSVKQQTVPCNPADENDKNRLCCNEKIKTFTPTIDFYTWDPMVWKAGGNREFYIDAASGVCADGGFLSARGPFYDNLLDLSKEAESRGILINFNKQILEITKPILVGQWILESYNGIKDIPASITFQEDGKFNVKICNSINGLYEIKNTDIKFNRELTTTLMACQGSIGTTEDGFHRLVSDMQKQKSETKIENGKLTLQTQTDSFIFTKK